MIPWKLSDQLIIGWFFTRKNKHYGNITHNCSVSHAEDSLMLAGSVAPVLMGSLSSHFKYISHSKLEPTAKPNTGSNWQHRAHVAPCEASLKNTNTMFNMNRRTVQLQVCYWTSRSYETSTYEVDIKQFTKTFVGGNFESSSVQWPQLNKNRSLQSALAQRLFV